MSAIHLDRLLQRKQLEFRMWAIVLLLAIKDRAVRVRYCPDQGDSALAYEVDGITYDLVPPPVEETQDLLAAVREFLQPRTLWQRLFSRVPAAAPYNLSGCVVAIGKGHELARIAITYSHDTVLFELENNPATTAVAAALLKQGLSMNCQTA